MTDDLGRILDTIAFQSMSNKQLIEQIADYVIRRRRDSSIYYRYNQSSKDMVEHRVDELVKKYGSIGGDLTRVKLVSRVLKRIRSKQSRIRTRERSKNGDQNA